MRLKAAIIMACIALIAFSWAIGATIVDRHTNRVPQWVYDDMRKWNEDAQAVNGGNMTAADWLEKWSPDSGLEITER